ncbi:Sushi, von Willebrand factor type A, EGF and pentraxin domain-containing protein 1 [Exaiptasia diaphana]|nr:Sushi, von Willebrand factor type A, EGF and pentraxin domain-containing protein 1 [Exaiptasia diaphana]
MAANASMESILTHANVFLVTLDQTAKPLKFGFNILAFFSVKTDFAIKIERAYEDDYVEVNRKLPTLKAFTMCLWVKTQDKSASTTIVSYGRQRTVSELKLYNPSSLSINMKTQKTGFGHIWDTFLTEGGKLLIGQDQMIQNQRNFIGEITGFNMWDKAFTQGEINSMLSDKCTMSPRGNVVQWSDVVSSPLRGVVPLIPSSCKTFYIDTNVNVKFIKEPSGNSKLTVYRMLPEMKAMTLCLWMKFDRHRRPRSVIVEYEVTRDLSPEILLVNSLDGLQFWIQHLKWDSKIKINDANWHLLCVTWTSSNGKIELYLDGTLRASDNDFRKGSLIGDKGDIRVGWEDAWSIPSRETDVFHLYRIEMWNRTLSEKEISDEVSKKCRTTLVGNVLEWSDVISGNKEGKVSTESNSCKNTQRTDYCTSNPCQNDGVCIGKHAAGYWCDCQPGYGGENCQNKIDFCGKNPCQNDGTCIRTDIYYSCKCKNGFSGDNCENNIDECASNPCQNEGNCHDRDGFYECECKKGFNGTNCEKNVDECVSNPCKNGGVCKDVIGSYTCQCKDEFVGKNCEIDTDVAIKISRASVEDYVLVKKTFPKISELTVCVWVKTADKRDASTIFSYSVPDNDNELTLNRPKNLRVFMDRKSWLNEPKRPH